MTLRYADYLTDGDDGNGDLADQIANSIYDDPRPVIWISPADVDDPTGPWTASYQLDDECDNDHDDDERDDVTGTRDEVIAWARRTPAAARYLGVGHDAVPLEPMPDDAPSPPPFGPTVQVQGPARDGRWVALWFHRGELRQHWGERDEVTAWALAQPAQRRRLSAHGADWTPLLP